MKVYISKAKARNLKKWKYVFVKKKIEVYAQSQSLVVNK